MICGLLRIVGQMSSVPVRLAGVGFLIASVIAAGPVQAAPDEAEAPVPPADVRATLAPTGKVRAVQVQDPGLQIVGPTRFVAGERALPAPTVPVEPRTLDLQGLQEAFGLRLINERMAELRRCRGEVAIAQHVAFQAVRAREVLIRWAVTVDGRVEDAAVVATAPTDPAVLDCVHRKVSAWQFQAPGERLLVKTPLVFESPSASAPAATTTER